MKKGNDPKDINIEVLNAWYNFADLNSYRTHWDWFVIDQFLRGNHNISGNYQDNSVSVGKSSDTIYYPINKIYSTFRAVRGFVTRHKPKFTIEPDLSLPNAEEYARRANSLLSRDNMLNNSRKINKEWVYYGIKYGVGYRQIGYDPKRKCSIRWSVDPFDFLIGSKTGEMQTAPNVIKTYVRTVAYLKNKYPDKKDMIVADNELAADRFKKLSLQIQYQNTGSYPGERSDDQTCIVKEAHYSLFNENSLGGTVNRITFIQSGVLEEAETPFKEYPFIEYKADIVPNEPVGEGHLKHIIAPQRMLNLLNTQMLEYNHIVNRGRFLVDKNSGFEVVNSKEGQIIRKNQGKQVQVLNPPSINPMLQFQIGLASEFIEDIGGQHQASQGATPPRVSSGDAIQALQLGDSNNISDLRDNFEDALSQEAGWILRMYSYYEKEGIVLTSQVSEKQKETFAAVGGSAYKKTGSKVPEKYYVEDSGDYCDAMAILPDHNVKVSITSELGETPDAKRDLLLKLLEAGLPLKVVLEHLEFPNSSDILQRIASESAADIVKQNLLNASQAKQPEPKAPTETINYKDAPPDIQRQMEKMAGFTPSEVGGSAPIEDQQSDQLMAELSNMNQSLGGENGPQS